MQQMEASPLGGAVDPEVFRRVWNRVMADGADSPIVVSGEAEGERPAPPPAREGAADGAERAVPRAQVSRPGGGRGTPGDQALLARTLEELGRGMALVRGMGPMGRRGPALSALAADYRRAARQLSAAYFLACGERRGPGGAQTPVGLGLARGLRELFWWERDWSGLCLEAAGQAEDTFLQELYRGLAQTGQIHLGIIRGALERMQGAALDGGRGLE